ncbi:MAG: DUF3343 domain-containing protein [Fusobacterium sp.]|nr:DUF3343 domain-containing protein [Fusobacterium sp.]
MIKDEKFLILSAESTHLIIQLEKNLLGKNIPCRVIPLPTEISANCGLAVRVETEYTDEIKKIVEDKKIKVTISLVEKHGLKKNIEIIYKAVQ